MPSEFGACDLMLAVPEDWEDVYKTADLIAKARRIGLARCAWSPAIPCWPGVSWRITPSPHVLISAEGTLETAPAIGYADMICDIVSSGQTLRDNRLRPLEDGLVISSQASLIANRSALKTHPGALSMARILLEYFEAHLRASGNLAVFANMRGNSPESVAAQIFKYCHFAGLQGPTISRVVVREDQGGWYAANLIVPRSQLFRPFKTCAAPAAAAWWFYPSATFSTKSRRATKPCSRRLILKYVIFYLQTAAPFEGKK